MNNISNLQQNLQNHKSKTCRICAIECENGQKLFIPDSEVQRLAVEICSFISIKLENIQNYPNWICHGCHLQCQATYQFFQIIKNGQNKLYEQIATLRKPGKKPKRKKVHMYILDDDQFDAPSSDNFIIDGKRVRKIPKRFKDAMQGNELEELYKQIGVTEPKTRQSTIEKKTIANIENQDGVTLGEMISIDQESHRKSTRYQCDLCKENFSRELAFHNHLSKHTNILYECSECKAVFRVKAIFDEHVKKTNHTGLGIVEIPPSLETPMNNQDESHAELAKEPIKQFNKFVCIKCSKSFDTNLAMQRHQTTHSENPPLKCDICLRKFKNKFILKVHKTSHTNERLFKCHLCLKRFNHKRSLKLHLQGLHDGFTYSCPTCKKRFSQKSNLKIHQRTHTGERPFVCLSCGASFKTSSQCRLHQKTHGNQEGSSIKNHIILEKNLPCKICGKLFSQGSNLRKHLRIHTGEKPYACSLCPLKFSDASNFKKHKQNHPKRKYQRTKPISLLKRNLNDISLNSDPNPDGLIETVTTAESNSFKILENVILPNVNNNNSLMSIINENEVKNSNQWNSDMIITDIPNDENSIFQQQQQQEMLMNQMVCISYQDPMNPIGNKTTFYVVNQGN